MWENVSLDLWLLMDSYITFLINNESQITKYDHEVQ